MGAGVHGVGAKVVIPGALMLRVPRARKEAVSVAAGVVVFVEFAGWVVVVELALTGSVSWWRWS
jgi:hypothetical protein